MSLNVRFRLARAILSPAGIRAVTIAGACALGIAYLLIWLIAPLSYDLLGQFWPFGGLGLAGALVANSTGVGGGVVFIPAFAFLRETGTVPISPAAAVGISFAIQCFGMTSGSLTWLNQLFRDRVSRRHKAWRHLVGQILLPVLGIGLPSLLLTQYALRVDSQFAFLLFKLFSIALGAALLLQLAIMRYGGPDRLRLNTLDWISLCLIGLVGGVATALFSVGTGELLALYLFIRRMPVDVAVSSAVIASALSVWTGLSFHIQAGHILWEILIYAAPAVVLGGYLARQVAHALGAVRLKLATGSWIILSSTILLLTS